MASTEVRQLIAAPRSRVYAALVDAGAVAQWRVPDGMTCEVHEFDPREGGAVRVSLIYDAPDAATELVAVHEGLPSGLDPAANETGWRESLSRLAALVERGGQPHPG